jgi:hypothetical protein
MYFWTPETLLALMQTPIGMFTIRTVLEQKWFVAHTYLHNVVTRYWPGFLTQVYHPLPMRLQGFHTYITHRNLTQDVAKLVPIPTEFSQQLRELDNRREWITATPIVSPADVPAMEDMAVDTTHGITNNL